MLRAMVFIDYQNFIIAVKELYHKSGLQMPKLDYTLFPQELTKKIPNADLIKTTLFIPKPDDFLMNDQSLAAQYKWASNLRSKPFFDVCEGHFISRSIVGRNKDIADSTSYYKVEKGTDINMAIEALSKAFYNTYDMAIFVSGDSDYISIYSKLNAMGKLTSVAAVKGQNISRVLQYVDHHQFMDIPFLNSCVMPQTV